MITGFNTDVEFNGRTYHVQTEDRGKRHPIVETLVYCGGKILTSRKTPYADLLDSGGYSEQAVLQRMEQQHQALMFEIRSGQHEEQERKPFGHAIVTNQSLDDVVREFLAGDVEAEPIPLEPPASVERP